MNCQDVKNRVLSAEKIFLGPDMAGHLAQCSECRDYVAAAQAIEAVFKNAASLEAPGSLWQKVMAAVEERPLSFQEKVGAWWEEVLLGFRPYVVGGSFAAAMMVMILFLTPGILFQSASSAASDKEEVVALAYMGDNEPALVVEDVAQGTMAEHLI
ncbi:MAG: hypothetical protein HQL19_03290 [Candidatus Omnitrophica bacterium]|nr:hypothetical protein [Candidatus Omnitrophota bacterium]